MGVRRRSQDIGNTYGSGKRLASLCVAVWPREGKAALPPVERRTLRTLLLNQAFTETVIQKGDGHQDYAEDQARQNSIGRRNFRGIED
jgi:hypothetical protein